MKIPKIEISEVMNLRFRFCLNVLVDTLAYSTFSFVMFSSLMITNLSHIEYRGSSISEDLRTYILTSTIYNTGGLLPNAFLATLLIVFIKHGSNSTADKSKEILKKIEKENARDN